MGRSCERGKHAPCNVEPLPEYGAKHALLRVSVRDDSVCSMARRARHGEPPRNFRKRIRTRTKNTHMRTHAPLRATPTHVPQPPTPGIWKSLTRGEPIDKHPAWPVHKACADTAFHALQVVLGGVNLSSVDGAPAAEPTTTFWPHDRLEVEGACIDFASFYSAEDAKALPLLNSSGWRRYEDRQGKPGWIGEGTNDGSTLDFAVRCGTEKTVGIEYLESYEHMGEATVRISTLEGDVVSVGVRRGGVDWFGSRSFWPHPHVLPRSIFLRGPLIGQIPS